MMNTAQTLTPFQALEWAVQLVNQGSLEQDIIISEQILALEPDNTGAWQCLAFAATGLHQPAFAMEAFQRTIQIDPQLTDCYLNLSNLFLDTQANPEAAFHILQQGVTANPGFYQGYYNMGLIAKQLKQLDKAVEAYDKAITIQPDFYPSWFNRGISLRDLGRLQDAVESYQKTINLAPDFTGVYGNLGRVLLDQGRAEEAMDAYRVITARSPDYKEAFSSLLFTQLYCPGTTLKQVYETHCQWDEKYGALVQASQQPFKKRANNKKLKLGFLGANFSRHPIGYFIIGILQALAQRDDCDIICYANQTTVDSMTQRFQAFVPLWRPVWGQPDEAVAEHIRQDEIDILFDLTGHIQDARLAVFAMRPAPVQITWAGYVATTGLKSIDYILADPVEIPPEAEAFYTEKVLRMPHSFICLDPPQDVPDVAPLPAEKNGFITFGCFNVLCKVNPPLIALWSNILNQLPTARLLMKTKALDCPRTVQSYRDQFSAHGVDPSRIDFLGGTTRIDHMAAYAKIDIQLDTIPYNGSTTTLESLYMGVPVLTLMGEIFPARHSASFLTTLNMQDWITRTPEEYIQQAIHRANDIPALAKIRKDLRPNMLKSPLCDPESFAEAMMAQLHGIWEKPR